MERQVESRNLELLRKAVQELQNLKSTIEQAVSTLSSVDDLVNFELNEFQESTIAEFAENTALAAKPELEKKLKLEQRAIDENLNSIKEQIGESTGIQKPT